MHSHSLIWIFSVRILNSQGCEVSSSGERRLIRLRGCAGLMNRCWAHTDCMYWKRTRIVRFRTLWVTFSHIVGQYVFAHYGSVLTCDCWYCQDYKVYSRTGDTRGNYDISHQNVGLRSSSATFHCFTANYLPCNCFQAEKKMEWNSNTLDLMDFTSLHTILYNISIHVWITCRIIELSVSSWDSFCT